MPMARPSSSSTTASRNALPMRSSTASFNRPSLLSTSTSVSVMSSTLCPSEAMRSLATAISFSRPPRERVGGGDVALGDHARGDEAAVRAVVVRHDERAHVVLAQQAPRLEQGGVMADGDGIGRHDIGHARVHVGDDVGSGDAVLLEDPGGLRRRGAEADGTVDAGRLFGILRPAGKFVLQIRVAHRCADRIVVRVLMAHDDDRCRHCCTPYPRALTRGAPLTLQSCGMLAAPPMRGRAAAENPSIAARAKRVSPDQPFQAQMSRKSQKAHARDGRTRP